MSKYKSIPSIPSQVHSYGYTENVSKYYCYIFLSFIRIRISIESKST